VRSPKCCICLAHTSHFRAGISPGGTAICFGISHRRNHGFALFASRAIISAQIKTNLVGFDAGQYQRSAAPGTRRAEVVDEFEIQGIDHGAEQPALLGAE
jgi:hypothetical protein